MLAHEFFKVWVWLSSLLHAGIHHVALHFLIQFLDFWGIRVNLIEMVFVFIKKLCKVLVQFGVDGEVGRIEFYGSVIVLIQSHAIG